MKRGARMRSLKTVLLGLIVALAALTVLLFVAPGPALAADSDFEVEYEFSPDLVGRDGGVVQLLLTVRNTGPTNITWLNVVINTATPFSSRWTGTIVPGASRRLSFNVTFSGRDLNTRKLLQVSMNNNSSANPDGVKTLPFELSGTMRMFEIIADISPLRTQYEPGDTVTISYSITNVIATHALMHMTTHARLTRGSDIIYTGVVVDLGNIFPGATKTTSFRYTFDEDDAGEITLGCLQEFTFLEVDYGVRGSPLGLVVLAPPPEVDFTATLYADRTEVDAGQVVQLRVALGNTGDDAISRFEITSEDGALEAATESLPAGGSGSVTLSVPVHETTTFRFAVKGTTGAVSETVETNAVTVTVRRAETSESTMTTATTTATAEGSTTSDTAGSPEGTPSSSENSSTETTGPPSTAATPVEATAEKTAGLSNTMLIVIIAAAAVVAIAAVVTTGVVVSKKRGD